MSEEKYADDDPERTLVTLEQLSQTIEVMTSVVNRLRQHLSEQLQAQLANQDAAELAAEADASEPAIAEAPAEEKAPGHKDVLEAQQQQRAQEQQQRESFVVEIRQQEPEPVRKNSKTLH